MTMRTTTLEKRRKDIATALIKGQTGRSVAKRMGIRHETVSRIANSPETKLIMSDLLRAHDEQVRRLVGKSLIAIEDAFDAQRVGCSKAGEAVDLGADHFARLAAAKRVQELLTLARDDSQPNQPGTVTWEAFLSMTARLPEPEPPNHVSHDVELPDL